MIKTKKCKKCNYRMTKLYLHLNSKGFPKWVPVYWYCFDCDKIGDRIMKKKYLKGLVDNNRKLYRHSNRKDEGSWIPVVWFNGRTDRTSGRVEVE